MFDDFLEGLSSKWQEFLDWSDEKGLPIRGTSDALEEKGIPPAPFFLGLLIVVLCGIGFLVFTNLPAQTATVTITVTGSDGLAVDNANVQLSSSIEANSKFNSTNERGLARFYNVPLGKYNVSVSSANYKPNSLAITVGQAPVLQEIKLEAKPVDVNASVIVKVALASGSGNPSISITDPSKNSYGMKTGTSVTFSLPMSRNYTILAYLDGYTPNETTIRIGAANPEPITLTLFPNAAENSVEVNLQVLLSASGNVSLADAQIQMYAMPANTLVRKFMCTSEGVVKLLLDKGAKLRFIASLSGYEDGVLDYVVSSSSPTPKITLAKIGADGKSKMSCRIIDEAGNKITQATFNIYKDNKKYVTPQKTGSDGNVSFSITEDESLWVTAYKPSYIPAGMFVQKGTDCSMVLKRSLKDNSAVVKVKVVDEIGGLLSGSAVSLFGSDGPLGLSESTTGSDGLVEFSDVPLGLTHATASYKSRSGFSDTKDVAANGEAGVNYTTLSVTLVPAKGTLKFRVIDRFSRRLIDGAEIDASTSDSASCSTSSGVCTVELLEGWGRYKVYAQGYSSYSSSQVQVVPNYEKEVLVELLSNSVAENVRAVYLGMYDLEGNRVSSLEPSTAYNAKFLLNAPDLKFSQALLHVRLGGETGDVSGLDAFISGFDAGSDASTSGGSAYGSDSGANSTFDSAEGEFDTIANSIEYKWVSFSLPSFAGTREATVQVTTRQVKNGTALFGFRTAYSTSNGTLRDPADDSVRAGQDNLAAVNKTKYSISFGGICSEELCLEAHVVSSRGEYARNFEVAVPEEFTIFVKSISTGGPYELRLSSESLTAAKILSGTSPSGSASVTEDKDGQLAVVEIPSGNVDSEFKVKALRVTDVLAFKIAVDYQGEQVSELEVSGRVIASSNNELKVGTLPSVLSALVDNKLMFLVTDAYDTPLSNAHIIVGTKNDLFGDATYSLDGTGEENAGKAGKYLLENVNPGKVGRVEYAITATGYATYYGSLAANAKTILEVDPSTGISILVESKEGNTDSFTVQNKLGNAVKVAAAIVLDKSPKITSTLLSTSEFSLDPLASKEVTFDTWISESVLDVAKSTRTLSENFTGKLIIEGRVGSSKQKITIPFTVKSAFLQSPLDEFWGVQEDSAELTLSLGAQTETSTSIHVYNDLSTNLLVNYQLDSSTDWLSYSPASLILGPNSGESGQIVFAGEEAATAADNVQNLTITARVPDSRKSTCVMENEGKIAANITMFASVNGVRSERKIPVLLSLDSDVDCAPENGIDVIIPIDMRVDVPATAFRKENSDGSVAVQLKGNEGSRVLFGEGSLSDSKTAPYVSVPSGSAITAPPSMVLIIKPQEEFNLVLPYATTYYIPGSDYFEKQNKVDGATAFVLNGDDIVTFPTGSIVTVSSESESARTTVGKTASESETTSATQPGYMVKVLANTAVNFKLSATSSACTTSVSIPKQAALSLPAGTQITTSPSGTQEAAMPDCTALTIETEDSTIITLPASNRILLPDSVEITRTKQASTASIPAQSLMDISVCNGETDDTFEASFGADVSFVFSEAKTASKNAIKFGSCQQISTSNGYTLPSASAMEFEEDTEIVTTDGGNTAVNVYAGKKVTFTSCACSQAGTGKVKLVQTITATGGKALSVKPAKIAFTLTDGALSASDSSVCIYNSAMQPLNVSVSDKNMPAGYIKADEDISFGNEYSHSRIVAYTKTETCTPVTIKVHVPIDMLDSYNCIKAGTKRQELPGKLKLTAKTQSGIDVSAKNLPEIDVKITVFPGTCDERNLGITDEYLRDVFVNYDSTLTDVKFLDVNNKPTKRVFAFKNSEHTRPLLIVNNRDQDVSMSFSSSDDGTITCSGLFGAAVPASIARSTSKELKCTSHSGDAKGKPATLTFTFKAADYAKTVKVNTIVYAPASDATDLYSSSPMGDILPLTRITTAESTSTPVKRGIFSSAEPGTMQQATSASFAEDAATGSSTTGTAATGSTAKDTAAKDSSSTTTGTAATGSTTKDSSATEATASSKVVSDLGKGVASMGDCTTNFCTYDQAQIAYTAFIGNIKHVVDFIAKDDTGFRKRLDAVCDTKSRGTGNAFSKTMVIQAVNMQSNFAFLNDVAASSFATVTNSRGVPSFAGCGIYVITATPQICNSRADASSASSFRDSVEIDIQVEKIDSCPETLSNALLWMGDNLEVVTGAEKTEDAAELVNPLKKVFSGDFLGVLGSIRLGVYRDQPNTVDETLAQDLVSKGYGVTKDESTENAYWRSANLYSDGAFCLAKGVWLDGLGATLIALDTVGAISGATLMPLVNSLSGCVSGTAIDTWGAGADWGCSAVCQCPMAAIASQFQVIPGLGGVMSKLSGGVFTKTTRAAVISEIKWQLLAESGITVAGVGISKAMGSSASQAVSAGAQTAIISSGAFSSLFSNRMSIIRSARATGASPLAAETFYNTLKTASLTSKIYATNDAAAAVLLRSITNELNDFISTATSKVDVFADLPKFESNLNTKVANGVLSAAERDAIVEAINLEKVKAGPGATCLLDAADIASGKLPFTVVGEVADADNAIRALLNNKKYVTAFTGISGNVDSVTIGSLEKAVAAGEFSSQSEKNAVIALIDEVKRAKGTSAVDYAFHLAGNNNPIHLPSDFAGTSKTLTKYSSAAEIKAILISASKITDEQVIIKALKTGYAAQIAADITTSTSSGNGKTVMDVLKNHVLPTEPLLAPLTNGKPTKEEVLALFELLEGTGKGGKGLPMEDILRKVYSKDALLAEPFSKTINKIPGISSLVKTAQKESELLDSVRNLRNAPKTSKLALGTTVLATVALFASVDCNFRPAESLANPGVANHIMLYSYGDAYGDEPSSYRACFNDKQLDLEETPLNADISTCLRYDRICPTNKNKQDYCIALAKTPAGSDRVSGFTLFGGIDQTKLKSAPDAFMSIFSSTTKPTLTATQMYRQKNNVLLPNPGMVYGDVVPNEVSEKVFDFIND